MQLFVDADLENLQYMALDTLRAGHEYKINYIRGDLVDGLSYVRSALVPVIQEATTENVYNTLVSSGCIDLIDKQDGITLHILCQNLVKIRSRLLYVIALN